MSKGDYGCQEAWMPGLALSLNCSGHQDQSLPLFRPLSPFCQALGGRGRTGLGPFQGPASTNPLKFCERTCPSQDGSSSGRF